MKKLLLLLALVCIEKSIQAQTRPPYIYTIKADSVLITNSCDTAELILENHTQNVPGFLFNKGRGRTEFRRPLQRISDTLCIIGADSLKLPYAWVQGGNAWGTTGIFGTRDNNHVDFYTNNIQRARLANTGDLLIGTTTDYGYNLGVNGATYSKYFTNSTTPLGDYNAGALRLRWGGGSGDYIEFYNQNDNNLRGLIMSPADSRPLTIFDRVGLSISNTTPFVAIGSEGNLNANTKLSVVTPLASTIDPFGVARVDTPDNQHVKQYSLMVKASGNTLIGNNNTDNGSQLQVNGSSYFNGMQQITGTASGPDKFAFTNFNPSVTSTGSDWANLYGMHLTPTLNASSTYQQLFGVSIDPTFNLNGTVQYPDAISAALHVSSVLGGIRIDQGASYPGNTGQPLDIEQRGTANKECIRNYREYVLSTLPFIWNHENRTQGNRSAIVSALRSTILNPNAGGGVSFSLDRYYWGTEASIELKYETYPAGDTLNTVNTSIAFKTEAAGVAQTPLYLNGGKAGMGTTTPTAQLHTTGTVRFAGLTNSDTLARVVVSDIYGNLYYRSLSSWAMNDVINSDLAINGTISAQKMKITPTGAWPDYVFSNKYKLPTLLQLEQYIKQNNHLPDVPSAAEVQKKGIDVADNQATLLKKIEELTLYVIEQEKKLQQQNEEISALKKQNATLDDLKQQVAELKELIKSAQK